MTEMLKDQNLIFLKGLGSRKQVNILRNNTTLLSKSVVLFLKILIFLTK